MERIITEELLNQYSQYLYEEEKSSATRKKYLSDLRKLMKYADGRGLTKELMIQYKEFLMNEKHYKSSSVNSYLVAANRFFEYMGWYGMHVKTIKVQQTVFVPEERELAKQDFKKLVKAAVDLKKPRIAMVIQTICGTGMRVSEVQFVTVEAVKKGQVTIYNKGKERIILIQKSLQMKLMAYIQKYNIQSGRVFQTASGKAMDRGYIWREMKKLWGTIGNKFPSSL